MIERQRTAINEALHELRRPLQALAFYGTVSGGEVVESSTRLAALALERIDREVNGGDGRRASEPVRCEGALRSAVGRWRAKVALGGGSLELRWRAGDAIVIGDEAGLEQAVDNLIVNAIEHGGPRIAVEAWRRDAHLVISVADSGRQPSPRGDGAVGPVAAISAGGRRGHGLALVRRFAAEHGGSFALRRGEAGSAATLELPLALGLLAADSAA